MMRRIVSITFLAWQKNDRLKKEIAEEMKQAEAQFGQTQQPARTFKEFRYQTLKSWSRERRVIGKAEYLEKAPIRDSSSPLCRLNAWMRVQLHRAEEMLAAVVRDRNR